MFITTLSSGLYLYLVFRKDLTKKPDLSEFNNINPISHIKNKKQAILSVSILIIVILFVLFKDFIHESTNLFLEN
jgi:Na+/H+ antiporter NhaD/arsenite permease-like protein